MSHSLSDEIAHHLPFLRRYARALTGTQQSGDSYVRACLQSIVDDPRAFPRSLPARVGLYRLFHVLWSSSQVPARSPSRLTDPMEQIAAERLGTIPLHSRQALLLTAMEGFSEEEAAAIMGIDTQRIPQLIAEALSEIDRQMRARVLIIEDEPLIALDLAEIVRDLGHTVAAVARTRSEAVAAAERQTPGLVLADVQLADGSSGIDAVKDILESFSIPVIFITAYPQLLLTGEGPEPAFLLTKPVNPKTVKAAISQALFFRADASMAA
ncbi:MAG: response regulator [Bauldia sp.]